MILYFSGTGNSEYVAKKLGKLTGDEAVNLFDRIRDDDFSPLHSEKPWVLVAPVYAWKTPWIVEDHLQLTELTGTRRFYTVLTCGSSIGGAGVYALKFCKTISMHHMGCAPVLMPENYFAKVPVPSQDKAKSIIADAEGTIEKLAEKINNSKPFEPTEGSRAASSFVNWYLNRFKVKDKKFYINKNCVSCGKCVSMCPLKNIEMKDGRPKWLGNCCHCMRCICMCPKDAIEYGTWTVGKERYRCPVKFEDE